MNNSSESGSLFWTKKIWQKIGDVGWIGMKRDKRLMYGYAALDRLWFVGEIEMRF
jgi:hypothetical protein